MSGRWLYTAFSFMASSLKKSFAKSLTRISSSSRHLASSPSWPFTLIIPFRIKCVSTISVFFFTPKSASPSPAKSRSLFSSTSVPKHTATSPRPITALARTTASFEVRSICNSSPRFASQYSDEIHINLHSVSAAARCRYASGYCLVFEQMKGTSVP